MPQPEKFFNSMLKADVTLQLLWVISDLGLISNSHDPRTLVLDRYSDWKYAPARSSSN